MMHILITRDLPDAAPAILRAAGHEITINSHDRPFTPEELLEVSSSADGLLTMLNDKIDGALLAQRPNIRAIANYAVGYNNIDVPACTARKIGVSNTPGVLTNATAEIAWTLLMAAARRAAEGERLLRGGAWAGWEPLQLLGVDVVGQTLGIVGAGRIGVRLAKMATGFDMKILYHNRKPNPEMQSLGAALVPLKELLSQSDFISLHVPLTAETRHLIGRDEFKLMKPSAVLINTARGPVVDEVALVEALKSRRIFAAGLDVYENEPTVHPGLFELENVILLPHIGSATIATRARMAKMAAENLVAMLAGIRPANPVNPEIWG
jgi:lactate dehydrogenase-like 2-hydroxyacid dehydrogenase